MTAALLRAVPADNTVSPGVLGFVVVALLGWSLTRHLRKARDNADQGAFGPDDKPWNAPS